MRVTHLPFDPGPAAWNALLPTVPAQPALNGSKTADIAVIGAGFAGLSAARRLNQIDPSLRIVVLEARRVGEGPAGRNSGFMIDLPHNLASNDYSGTRDSDSRNTAMNREAISFAAEAAAELEMSSETFAMSGKINAAATEKGNAHNKNYAAHLADLDERHEMLDAQAMREICGSHYYRSGLFTPGTALIQPAMYVRGLSGGLISKGVVLHENSPVVDLTRNNGAWTIATQNGRISCKKVVLATNGHAESFGFFRRRLIHIYLYASMTKPLSPQQVRALGGEERWAFTPANPMGTTVRRISGTAGDRIIVRNRFTWAPQRYVPEDRLEAIGGVHDRSFRRRFPMLAGVEMDYRWGGLLCLSLNSVPAFGEIEPGLFSACCQNGLGTAMGTLSGKLVAELIAGIPSQSLLNMQSHPDPRKLPPEPFLSLGANATMRWGEAKAGREL